jgi:hypothetical protein
MFLPPSSSLFTCIYIVFQNSDESPWNSFLLETMQVGITFTILFNWLYLITIQLGFIPYFQYHFTIFFHIFHIISVFITRERHLLTPPTPPPPPLS